MVPGNLVWGGRMIVRRGLVTARWLPEKPNDHPRRGFVRGKVHVTLPVGYERARAYRRLPASLDGHARKNDLGRIEPGRSLPRVDGSR